MFLLRSAIASTVVQWANAQVKDAMLPLAATSMQYAGKDNVLWIWLLMLVMDV